MNRLDKAVQAVEAFQVKYARASFRICIAFFVLNMGFAGYASVAVPRLVPLFCFNVLAFTIGIISHLSLIGKGSNQTK